MTEDDFWHYAMLHMNAYWECMRNDRRSHAIGHDKWYRYYLMHWKRLYKARKHRESDFNRIASAIEEQE